MNKNILMVVTSNNTIGATSNLTGVWLEEFVVPYLQFTDEGFNVTVASPKGGAAPVDPRSEPTAEHAALWAQARATLSHTLPLEAVAADDFDAIMLPGGHGTMFDLPQSTELQRLLRDFDKHGKIIAAVCHGPAGLVGATRADGTPLVAGKTITAFTDSEERAAQMDAEMPFLLESRLRGLGAEFVRQSDWADHVEQDGNLITGQNPQSSLSIARAIVAALAPVPTR